MTKYKFDEWAGACQIATLGEIYEQHIGYKEDGFFVDIGAFDGLHWSNTAPLVEAGWRGIMVEPSPVFSQLYKRLGSNAKITLKNCGIGLHDGEALFFLGGSESTFIFDLVKTTPSLSIDRVTRSLITTMNTLLTAHDCPARYDVLSIDVEGGEVGVLGGYSLDRWRPKLAIIEMNAKHANRMLAVNAVMIATYFQEYGYSRIYCDAINSIYLDEKP